MSVGQIIDQIWQLPWYKVLVIDVVDDFILMIKIWPLFVGVAALVIYFVWDFYR